MNALAQIAIRLALAALKLIPGAPKPKPGPEVPTFRKD